MVHGGIMDLKKNQKKREKQKEIETAEKGRYRSVEKKKSWSLPPCRRGTSTEAVNRLH